MSLISIYLSVWYRDLRQSTSISLIIIEITSILFGYKIIRFQEELDRLQMCWVNRHLDDIDNILPLNILTNNQALNIYIIIFCTFKISC